MSDKEETLLSGPVCRWWRQIVYTPTKLWVSVHVIASPSTHSSHSLDAARREATSSWLSRSGGLPLSISMIISGLHAVGWYSCSRSRDASNSQVQLHLDPPWSLMLSVGNTSFYCIATSTGGNSRQAQWFPCCKAFILTMTSYYFPPYILFTFPGIANSMEPNNRSQPWILLFFRCISCWSSSTNKWTDNRTVHQVIHGLNLLNCWILCAYSSKRLTRGTELWVS